MLQLTSGEENVLLFCCCCIPNYLFSTPLHLHFLLLCITIGIVNIIPELSTLVNYLAIYDCSTYLLRVYYGTYKYYCCVSYFYLSTTLLYTYCPINYWIHKCSVYHRSFPIVLSAAVSFFQLLCYRPHCSLTTNVL